MTARNDVTGDRIATKPSRAYEDNYDRIFRKPKATAAEPSPTTDPAFAEFLRERGVLEELYGDDV